jgi:hypothetical protein
MLKGQAVGAHLGAAVVLVAGLAVGSLSAAEAEPTDPSPAVESPVVATVSGEQILEIEIDRFIALGFSRPASAEEPDLAAYRRRVLDEVIDARLRAREVERLGLDELPTEEVEASLVEIRQRFGSREAFEARLEELGLAPEDLRRLVKAELLGRLFAEERVDPRLLIDRDQMKSYYETVLEPDARAAGERLPPFDETSLTARRLVEARLVREELESWTAELREQAEIEVLALEPAPPSEGER